MDLQSLRDRAQADRQAIIDRVKAAGRQQFTSAEDAEFRRLTEQIDDYDSRIDEAERRDSLHSAADRIYNASQAHNTTGTRTMRSNDGYNEGGVYTRQTQRRGISFIRDMLEACSGGGDGEARARLARHTAETRDISGLDTVPGDAAGFSFAPPQYALDAWAKFARAGSPLYNLMQKRMLVGPTVKIPKLTSGSTANVQTTQNTTIATSEFVTNICPRTPKPSLWRPR